MGGSPLILAVVSRLSTKSPALPRRPRRAGGEAPEDQDPKGSVDSSAPLRRR